MYCPNCGTPNADEARFCVNCGRPLAPTAAPSPPTPPPAYPAYPAAPMAMPRPAGALGAIRLLGLITLGLSILIILGFFLMDWGGGPVRISGWDLFNGLVLRDLKGYFDGLGKMFQAVAGGYRSWTIIAWAITLGLLWLIPLSALVTGIYSLFFVAVPQTVRRVRVKVLEIGVALVVLGAFLGFGASIAGSLRAPSLSDLGYGFWVTLVGSGVLFLVGLFGVAALVPSGQR